MNHLSRWTKRLQEWFRPDDVERNMDAEMRLHLEMEAQDLRLMGLSANEARRRAALAFGGVERFKEEARETRPLRLIENLTRDIQLAFRQLRRARGLAIAASTLLALGIGGTVAVFSVLNAVHFRPLPYPESDRLVSIQVRSTDPRCGERCLRDLGIEEAQSVAEHVSSIEKLGSIRATQGTLFARTGARIVKGAAVSESLSELLMLRPALGRSLSVADFKADAPGVMLLSHSSWISDFGRDSSIIGRSFTLDEATFTIAGVLTPSAELGSPLYSYNSGGTAQYIIPDRGVTTRASSIATVVARMREGRSIEQVRAQVDPILLPKNQNASAQPPVTARVSVEPLRDVLANGYRASFWTLFGAVAIVLLITCFNVTGLFLARLTDRANELATRTALGASRIRLAQQIGTETIVIAAAGGVGGLIIANLGTSAIRLLPTGRLPFWSDVSIDAPVVAFAILLTAGAALILSIAPIFVLSPSRLLVSLRETISASRSRSKLRGTLVAIQVALSVVLLGSAGLLTKVLVDAELRDWGTTEHSMLYVLLETPDFTTDAAALSLQQRIVDELRRVPGVLSAAVAGETYGPRPPHDRNAPRPPAMSIEGRPDALTSAIAPSGSSNVSPAYFETMGTRIVRGRSFTDQDRSGSVPVAIIDEPTERRMFGVESGIGKRVKFGDVSSENVWMTIVGIAAPLVINTLEPDEPHSPKLYRPLAQVPVSPSTALVRFSNNSYSQKRAVNAAIGKADPLLPILKLLTIEESIGSRLFSARFNTYVLGGFALFAVLLSCLGIYAAVTISVASRQREIAIRMALGELKREVTLVLIRSTTNTVALGIVLGLIAAAFATKTLQSMLHGTSPLNPVIYGLVVFVMLATGLLAALIPARRAARTDPARMLRS